MILGLDAGTRTVPEAEHLLHDMVEALGLPAGTIGCTHFVRTATGLPHVALSLSLAGDPADGGVDLSAVPESIGVALGERRNGPGDLAEGAALAAAEHAGRSGGRLVVYPGHAELTGTLSVSEVLARSAIDQVAVLAQAEEPPSDAPVATQDFVRPQWRDGRAVLLTMPARGGLLMPAEVPNPTPCCADHS
ncbi:hypothetical protein [Sphaerisporangium sp. NPDC051011]|uniref:hypothetical protein n=1 Tax=Sphaerisporangium sp. NPDC051011 TaxID=3155792 RepID=UPI00340C9DD1